MLFRHIFTQELETRFNHEQHLRMRLPLLLAGIAVAVLHAASIWWDRTMEPTYHDVVLKYRLIGIGISLLIACSTWVVGGYYLLLSVVLVAINSAAFAAATVSLPFGFAYGIGAFAILLQCISWITTTSYQATLLTALAYLTTNIVLYFGSAAHDTFMFFNFYACALAAAVIIRAFISERRMRRLFWREIQHETRVFDTERMTTIDPNSGLINRRAFLDLGRREIARSKRRKDPLSIMVIQIPLEAPASTADAALFHHDALRTLASVCQGAMRETDVLTHIAPQEFNPAAPQFTFAAVLADADPTQALKVPDRLQETINNRSVLIGSTTVTLQADVKVYSAQNIDDEFSVLLKQAGLEHAFVTTAAPV
jgi:diguanylate cyclase (GGDEF)-like protein